MKHISLLIAIYLLIGFQNCTTKQIAEPILPSSTAGARIEVALPTISAITSAAPCNNCTNTSSLNINWSNESYVVSITGTSLATTTLALTDAATGKTPVDYASKLKSTSDTKIEYFVGATANSIPRTLVFTLTNSSKQSVSKTVAAIPLLQGKVFGSAPHYVNKKRIELGFSPLPFGFGQKTGTLNQDWQPQRGDVWLYPDLNFQSIVTSVSLSTKLISQNAAGKVEELTYQVGTAEFVNNREANMSRAIVFQKTTTTFVGGSVRYSYVLKTSNTSAFSATNKSVATSYYR